LAPNPANPNLYLSTLYKCHPSASHSPIPPENDRHVCCTPKCLPLPRISCSSFPRTSFLFTRRLLGYSQSIQKDVLGAYKQNGDGDREMLIAMLNAKAAEDQRLANTAALHRSVLEFYQDSSPSSSMLTAPMSPSSLSASSSSSESHSSVSGYSPKPVPASTSTSSSRVLASTRRTRCQDSCCASPPPPSSSSHYSPYQRSAMLRREERNGGSSPRSIRGKSEEGGRKQRV